MKHFIFAMLTLCALGFSAAANAIVPPGAFHFITSHGVTAQVVHTLNEPVRECDKAPLVLAKRPGENYNFEVTQCELQSNPNIVPVQ